MQRSLRRRVRQTNCAGTRLPLLPLGAAEGVPVIILLAAALLLLGRSYTTTPVLVAAPEGPRVAA